MGRNFKLYGPQSSASPVVAGPPVEVASPAESAMPPPPAAAGPSPPPPALKVVSPEPAPAPLPRVARYRVLKAKVISWHGAMTHLKVGSVVTLIDYGALGIDSLVKQGVRLEPAV